MEQKIQEMQALVNLLNEASTYYYSGKGERMTDYEWDAAFDKLRLLEEETGTVLPDSPTNKVSEEAIVGQKEEHEFPALSLAKTKNAQDLVKWADGKAIWISWKLDGLTLVVTYDGGKLSKVVTRGNGHIGTNITHLAQAIKGIPDRISDNGHVVIRGECVISYADFDQFLLESGEDYANPRNLASGSLTLKNAEEVKLRHLQWIPFSLVYTEQPINSWGGRMDWIEKNGMKPVERECVEAPTLEHIEASIARWTEKVTAMKNPFPVDGLVISYDDYAYSQTGSVTGHHATRSGYAFKWQDESATTTLDHIEWSCAASTISPVAVFQPVNLEGTVVKRASLCNISECRRLGIGGKDSRLVVIKANKIIPKVIKVEQKVGDLLDSHPLPRMRRADRSQDERSQWHADPALHQRAMSGQATEEVRPLRIEGRARHRRRVRADHRQIHQSRVDCLLLRHLQPSEPCRRNSGAGRLRQQIGHQHLAVCR